MSFTRDNFISNTSSDLIQNNEQSHVSQGTEENNYNCIVPPTFKIQIYNVGYQSDQKFLHRY